MKSTAILDQVKQITAVKDLTSVFESIASLRIARVKDRVASSQAFFSELWKIYTELRVDAAGKDGGWSQRPTQSKPNCYLVLTSEGGLSGDIDARIISAVTHNYDPATTDLIVVGAHGQLLLAQQGITPSHHFRLPPTDQIVDVHPITRLLLGYRRPTAFYQKYRSLAVQEIGRIDLLAHVQTLASKSARREDVISTAGYIFEPDLRSVVQYLEAVMLGIAINQLILESRLAQYASRFSAMYAASQTAGDLLTVTERTYRSTRRRESDERAKEIISARVVQHGR